MRRRQFLCGLAGGTLAVRARPAGLTRSNVCFITDEVSPDLRVALQFAAEYGVRQVELRTVEGRYCFAHDRAKLREIRALLQEHGIAAAILATPVLKCALPGGVLTAQTRRERLWSPSEPYRLQMEFLRQACEAARILETDKLRIFSYWRVEDRGKQLPRILEDIGRFTEAAERQRVRLCVENDPACNVADCAEMASVLVAIPTPLLGAVWNVANGTFGGEPACPDGLRRLDASRLYHVRISDARWNLRNGGFENCPVGDGPIPYAQVLTALDQAGYNGALSIETGFPLCASNEGLTRKSVERLLRLVETL